MAPQPVRPVIVFEGRNELEVQLVRDTLASAMVPVLHIPSPTAGVFGSLEASKRVAVPSEYVEQALQVLRDAGFEPKVSSPARGLAALQQSMESRIPTGEFSLPARSWLRRVLIGLAVAIAALVLLAIFLHQAPTSP
jgi:hypothetical protein